MHIDLVLRGKGCFCNIAPLLYLKSSLHNLLTWWKARSQQCWCCWVSYGISLCWTFVAIYVLSLQHLKLAFIFILRSNCRDLNVSVRLGNRIQADTPIIRVNMLLLSGQGSFVIVNFWNSMRLKIVEISMVKILHVKSRVRWQLTVATTASTSYIVNPMVPKIINKLSQFNGCPL